ncbi:50S ribosomal protein L11 [bacterium]|nr:50S ribosomal protein L11 [bacterium]
MAKEILAKFKIQAKAGEATPAPPLGPALGQYGVNIVEFCNQFNQRTQEHKGMTVTAEVTVYKDRSFEFTVKTPPTSELIKKTLGIEKGSAEPNKKKVGKLTLKQLEEIAKIKLPDLNTNDLKKAMKIVAGTAKSMGVEVEGIEQLE